MFCSLSGEAATEPVVSKFGHVYERRLIVKHLNESGGKCPVTGAPLAEEDLIAIQGNRTVRPRPAGMNSIPGILSALQNEWDELALEAFTLRQHLDATRQELSQALYQHDAACRVIARLMRERDEARAQLLAVAAGVTPSAPAGATPSSSSSGGDVSAPRPPSASMEVEPVASSGALPNDVLAEMTDKCAELSASRRGRKPSPEVTSKDAMLGFSQKMQHTNHKSDKPGVTALAVCSSGSGILVLSGGMDKQVILTDGASGKAEAKIAAHSKKVSSVAFHPHFGTDGNKTLFSASADGTVKVWKAGSNDKYSEALSVAPVVGAEVASLAVHPTGHYAASAHSDGSWALLDLRGEAADTDRAVIYRVPTPDASSAYLCNAFHPDGLIVGCGTNNGVVKIWDARDKSNVGNCQATTTLASSDVSTSAVNSLSYSENGYLLAAGYAGGMVRLWDLRKLKCTKEFQSPNSESVASVSFDYSGLYLAVAHGNAVSSIVVKEWPDLSLSLSSVHSKPVTAVAWAPNARQLVSASMDRTVRIFGL